jgi:glyoxylase-like metal-dependent hydrolase (beta-lactamase superfamily II)
MHPIHIIDLHFQAEQSIAAFIVPTSDGPILIETGPDSTWPNLEYGILKSGFKPKDIRHVFVSHIHFDHAGAAWRLADLGATVYVHPKGLPHLANPAKLWNSASQIYGADMERLWGEMRPIPETQLRAVNEGDVLTIGDQQVHVWYTPGHAVHHVAYQIGDVVFTGDVAGVKIGNGPVQPPCPPPDIHVELWLTSIQKLKNLAPSALYLTHFGRHDNAVALLDELETNLREWTNWLKPYFEKNIPAEAVIPAFEQYVQAQLIAAGLDEQERMQYEYANPAHMSVTGIYRYWKLKAEGRI